MELIMLSIGVLLFLLSYVALKQTRRRGLPMPPSPPSLPLIGHIHLLSTLPHQDLGRLSIRYGPLFCLRLGFVNCVVASSPQMAMEFFKTNDLTFASRPRLELIRIISYNSMDMAFAPYGEHWKNLRKIAMKELFTPKKLQETKYIRNEEINCTVESIMEDSVKNRAVDLRSKLSDLTTNIITRMVVGKKFLGKERAGDGEQFGETVKEVFLLAGAFYVGDFLPVLSWLDPQRYRKRMEAAHLKMDPVLQRIVDEELHEMAEGRKDVSDNLVRVLLQVGDGEDGGLKLDHATVKAIIQDMLLAGSETNAVTVEFAMAELFRHPVIMQRVKQELDHVVAPQRSVHEHDIPKLPLLQAVVKETFRLHPPFPLLLPRESTQHCNVAGCHIPKGTRLIFNAWQMGRDPNTWKDPHLFNPDRFANANIDVTGKDFELIPFGSGRRICPGMSLALPVVHVILARLLHTFNWKASQEVELQEKFGLTTSLARPLYAFAMPHLNST